MGMRFRKSFKLAPGIRMNLSGSGLSYSVGGRGASMSFGKRGTYLNGSIPGTGISSRHKISGTPTVSRASSAKRTIETKVSVHIDDEGLITFKDENGNLAPEHWVTAAKKQQGEAIRELIQGECDKINARIEALGLIHQYTPNPREVPKYIASSFDTPQPLEPLPRKPGFFISLFKKWVDRIEQENQQNAIKYQESLSKWHKDKQAHADSEKLKQKFLEVDIYSDTDAMLSHLENNLQDISWPQETLVSFDIFNEGQAVFLDVDLPEVEDLPRKTATVPSRGYKLSIKEMSATQVQKLYMSHVHGIGVRIIGEVFASLPSSNEVVLSAYSQRSDPATGQMRDDYLYSVKVSREAWERINFDSLEQLDVVEALTAFELQRVMSKTGVFKPVTPFTP